ncbi:MAG: alpha/beta fold hydrolase [Pseudomonadota bacterium]
MDRWDLPLTFTFDGQEVRYGILGDEEAPPLVLLHGTPFSSYVWRRIAPLLAQRYRVHFHDMPGYGRSTMEAGQDVSLGIQNRVFAALLKHWGLAQEGSNLPHVVAHDFGGATALRAHLLDGCAYRSLTLIDPVAIRPWGSPLVQHVNQHETAFAGMPAYMHQAILPPYIRSALHRPVADATLEGYIAPWLGARGQAAFYRQIAQMDMAYTDEVQGRYGEIEVPAQILWGEEDQWIPVERGRELAAMIPQARFIPVPNCGHLMQEDAPEAIMDALWDFLGGV